MLQVVFVLLRGVLAGFRSRRDVALENLVLRHQLQVALRTNPTPPLGKPDRLDRVWLRRQLWPSGREHLLIVRPETVVRWHRNGWRIYWSWKSRTTLGIVVSKRSIRRYRWRKPTPGGSQRWRTFLSNQLKGIWAANLLVVHTINYRVL